MPGPREPTDIEPELDPSSVHTRLTAEQLKEYLAARQAALKEAESRRKAEREANIAAGRITMEEMTGKELAEHHPGATLHISPMRRTIGPVCLHVIDKVTLYVAEVFDGY